MTTLAIGAVGAGAFKSLAVTTCLGTLPVRALNGVRARLDADRGRSLSSSGFIDRHTKSPYSSSRRFTPRPTPNRVFVFCSLPVVVKGMAAAAIAASGGAAFIADAVAT